MAVLSAGWLGAAALQKEGSGQAVSSLWEGYRDPLAWLVLLWPALGQYSSGEITAVAAQSRCAPLLPKVQPRAIWHCFAQPSVSHHEILAHTVVFAQSSVSRHEIAMIEQLVEVSF